MLQEKQAMNRIRRKRSIFQGAYTRIRILILFNIIAILITFMIGVIHPYAVLDYEFFRAFLGFAAVIIFLISIINFIRDLFLPDKKVLRNLLKIGLSYTLVLIFALSEYITFPGLRVHYFFVKDYDVIRN